MRHILSVFLGLVLSATPILTIAADPQAESFSRIYTGVCVQHIIDLGVLREKLRGAPQLPPEKASLFLGGWPGVAFPVADPNGTFVVALPAGKQLCALFARRLNAEAAKENFLKLARNAPRPYVARLVSEESTATAANGPTKTIMYEWTAEGAMRKVVLTLTTATSEQADLQGMASIALSH